MEYLIPIETRRQDYHRWQILLHLLVVFTLVATGAFLITYQAVWRMLRPEERVGLYKLEGGGSASWAIIGCGLALMVVVVIGRRTLRRRFISVGLRVVEAIVMVGFGIAALRHGMNMPAVLYGLVGLAIIYSFIQEHFSGREVAVLIDANRLHVPLGARSRTLRWQEVRRVLLQHGVLTIDCVDNRLYQWNVAKKDQPETGTFQEFCFERIHAAKPLRRKSADW